MRWRVGSARRNRACRWDGRDMSGRPPGALVAWACFGTHHYLPTSALSLPPSEDLLWMVFGLAGGTCGAHVQSLSTAPVSPLVVPNTNSQPKTGISRIFWQLEKDKIWNFCTDLRNCPSRWLLCWLNKISDCEGLKSINISLVFSQKSETQILWFYFH